MPELPEVETIKRDLSQKILHKKIIKVEVRKKRIVKNGLKEFLRILTGNKFVRLDRIGKLLIFVLERDGYNLLVHLKMTGQLIYCHQGDFVAGGHSLPKIGNTLPNKYSHVIFTFADNSRLFFNDMRQFGYLHLVKQADLEKIENKYGIEPLTANFKLVDLKTIIKKRSAPIKAVLLNQQLISGIGNIYADEILFAAKVRPDRKASTLSDAEIKKIHSASQKIIKAAIKFRGTTFNDYVDANGNVGSFVKFLKVYGRKDKKCSRCSSIVKKIKMSGRGTHYCPACQK